MLSGASPPEPPDRTSTRRARRAPREPGPCRGRRAECRRWRPPVS
ncbi:hypothetical protein GGD63_004552 [Bradyrhizobium sp. cir1]|nr:hypothetical protein [Bradyrhizobium sp. cir1]